MKTNAFPRDPFRALMLAVPDGRVQLAMGAVLCAAFGAVVWTLCAGMQGVGVIALVCAACVALLVCGAWRALRGEPVVTLLAVALLAMLAIGAHAALLGITPGRMTKVLTPMLEDMWYYDLPTAMAWEEGAWSGGYLLVMALVSRLETFPQMTALKLFDMVCQCVAALAVLRLATLRGAKPLGAVAGMLACVLAPTMLLNAGCWAQCDATFAALTLWGLALLLDDHPLAGCVLWGLALGTKLQSAFVFPLLLVLFMTRRVCLRHLLALPAAFIASQAAILLDGQRFTAMLSRYSQQIETMRYAGAGLADHAANVYGLMSVASVREFSDMGLYLGIALALLIAVAMIKRSAAMDRDTLLLGALLLATALPLILPQMHARSLYLAGMLAFACAGDARRVLVAAMLEVISLGCYMASIFGFDMLPQVALSLLAIVAAMLLAHEMLQRLMACPAADAREVSRA